MKKLFRSIRQVVYITSAAVGLYMVIRQLSEQKNLLPRTKKASHQLIEENEEITPKEIAIEASPDTQTTQTDNLKKIEGIGPKIEKVLNSYGVYTYQQLSEQTSSDLQSLLKEAGMRLANPQTWPNQASLAAKGAWQELTEYQATLKGGKIAG